MPADVRSTVVPSLLRRMNEQQVLRALRIRGEASKAEISRETGVSYPTVSKIVAGLLKANVLEEGEMSQPSLGRPAKVLRIAGDTVQVLGLTLGPKSCEVVAAGLDGRIREVQNRRFQTPNSYAELLEAIVREVSSFGDGRSIPTLGLGIAVPGVLNYRDRRVDVAPAIHQIDGHCLGDDLRQKLGVNVIVVQSMHAVYLAERTWGLARDVDHFALVGIASGLGLAMCSGGRLVEGHRGLAGELGHLIIDPNGERCGCGKRGCLETVASDTALAATVSQKIGRTVEMDEVVSLVRQGELELDSEIERFLQWLATGLAAVINLFNPGHVFIYGRFLDLSNDVLTRLIERTGARALDPLMGDCKIVRVERKLREGAVAAAIQHLTGQLTFDVI